MNNERLREMIHEALVREGARLVEQAKQMRPVIVGDLWYDAPFYAYGQSPVECGQPPTIVDSTAIVIDEDVKALPEPRTTEVKR